MIPALSLFAFHYKRLNEPLFDYLFNNICTICSPAVATACSASNPKCCATACIGAEQCG